MRRVGLDNVCRLTLPFYRGLVMIYLSGWVLGVSESVGVDCAV